MTDPFDRSNAAEFVDGPTELPPPWSTPPDPEFPTGMIPLLEPADLSGSRQQGVEPSDSSTRTVRFSRHEMRDMVAARMRTGRLEKPVPAAPVPAAPVPAGKVQAASVPAASVPAAVLPLAPGPQPRADDATPSPQLQQLLASGWQAQHTAIAIGLALAFVLGVLTGVLAMR